MTERQKQMKKQYEEITKNEPEELFEYYNDLVPGYLNIGKYLEEIPNVFDKIVLAQNCCDEETLKKLLSQVQLSEDQQKKYQKLLSKNDELNMTLNFNLLNNKYDFLNPIMDLITTNVNIQERILSLSDEKLELFKKMFSHLQTVTKFPIPYVDNILKRIGESPFEKNKNYYDKLTSDMAELIKNDYPITEKDIETLLYVYNSDFISLPIENLWDVRDFNNIINNWLEEEINTEVRCKENPNLDVLKNDILLKAYGICKNTAENIKKVFDFSNIEITLENKDIIKTYTTIINILNEQDPNILLKVYDEFSKTEELQFDFMQSIVLGQDLKTVFAHELTKETFKTENNDFMMVGDVPVYDAGTDFRMIVTALGAYQADFGNKDNYSNYWNSSKIRSHGNCCSLIANNNMSMAKVRNVILGFSSMDDQMLMAAGTSDLSSSDDSQDLFMDYKLSGNYMSPNDMINNTRSDYNELVFERRDLSENATN